MDSRIRIVIPSASVIRY
nr:TPA_asm: m14.5 sORF 1 [Murid betaherpesvirus 1]DBA07927.1 TPA_asm: m14.5 sORF 1 [Murid betaherpesvirus 1]